jgi:hypothetical protein
MAMAGRFHPLSLTPKKVENKIFAAKENRLKKIWQKKSGK